MRTLPPLLCLLLASCGFGDSVGPWKCGDSELWLSLTDQYRCSHPDGAYYIDETCGPTKVIIARDCNGYEQHVYDALLDFGPTTQDARVRDAALWEPALAAIDRLRIHDPGASWPTPVEAW